MSKTNLKPVSPRTPAREALAQAIANADAARRQVKEVVTAAENAWERQLEAMERRDALLLEPTPSAPDIIAALARGDCDVLAVERRQFEARDALADAEREVAAWRRAKDEAKAEISVRQEALYWADRKVRTCVGAVLAESGAIDRLRDEAERLQGELIDRRVALIFLEKHAELPAEEKHQLSLYLSRSAMLPREATPHHEAAEVWARAAEALARDADAAFEA